jgi:hypothetical protein
MTTKRKGKPAVNPNHIVDILCGHEDRGYALYIEFHSGKTAEHVFDTKEALFAFIAAMPKKNTVAAQAAHDEWVRQLQLAFEGE